MKSWGKNLHVECHLGFHFAFKSGKRQGRKIRQGRREEGGGVEVLGGGKGKEEQFNITLTCSELCNLLTINL